jgi:hypothetical protein
VNAVVSTAALGVFLTGLTGFLNDKLKESKLETIN